MNLENRTQFDEIISKEKLTVVDFYAVWCGPCKMLSPILEQVENKVSEIAKIVKVNVDEFGELAAEYQIQSVPTLIFIKNNQEIFRRSGFLDENNLIALIEQYK